MNCYYVKIHFGGPYVSGFVVPAAQDEQAALKILKTMIRAKLLTSNDNYPGNDGSTSKLKEFMRSLKRPWRYHGGNRRYKEKTRVPPFPDHHNPVVTIEQMIIPVHAGYWLKEIPSL